MYMPFIMDIIFSFTCDKIMMYNDVKALGSKPFAQCYNYALRINHDIVFSNEQLLRINTCLIYRLGVNCSEWIYSQTSNKCQVLDMDVVTTLIATHLVQVFSRRVEQDELLSVVCQASYTTQIDYTGICKIVPISKKPSMSYYIIESLVLF